MPERSQDLEMYRERFLDQLHSSKSDLVGHQEFMRYWKLVEREAKETEELGKLEDWVRSLNRDKDRVEALKHKLERVQDSDPGARVLLSVVRQILDLLDGIEKKLRHKRDGKRRRLGFLIMVAGPGVRKKSAEEEAAKGAEGEKTEDTQVKEAVLAKSKSDDEKKKPTKKMTR